jgi:hypothetical protein
MWVEVRRIHWRIHPLRPIAYHRGLQRRRSGYPETRARSLSLDVWKVGTLIRGISNTCNDVFSSLKRGPDGRFKDSDLAGIMKNAYVAPLGSER